MSLELLYNLSSIRIHIPKDLRTTERRRQVAANVREVFRRFPDVSRSPCLCSVLNDEVPFR